MPKVDTVRDNHYKPIEQSEAVGGGLFWVISILSIAALFVDKSAYPLAYDILQVVFIVCVLLFFFQGQIQKLYLFPRAEDKRRQELLSNSFGVALTHEQTVGYYNNDQTNPLKRLAASVMESTFFTHGIIRKMLVGQRTKTLGYFVVYLIAVLNRSTSLELLAVAAQAVFSEDIIARWLRMEWLRYRTEQVFEHLNRLFTGKPAFSRPPAQSQAIDLFSFYETTKSTAAILLSSNVFHKNNVRLTGEWEQIRERLGL
ncbi:MAG: hypothetical protein FP825_15750 [Hyphomonas sp.]|uniref:hypothetical protein n=1 Tax=Hyphomonas sp. TaxID=87 RepID=UPI0018428956|nr:hypothetical protein [Hyphomonas sp.]MBA3069925.1 hypothetical protein [Hyphomonas sp.]MBU4060499.1 hypothetical protein [Alphaproteobacteria bacterium]MBU4163167.1 hypothetical protein [Alphaproteobacteria bacterium]